MSETRDVVWCWFVRLDLHEMPELASCYLYYNAQYSCVSGPAFKGSSSNVIVGHQQLEMSEENKEKCDNKTLIVIRREMSKFYFCYKNDLRKNSRLCQGRFIILLKILILDFICIFVIAQIQW